MIEAALARTRSVSVTFYGRRPDGTPVTLDIEDLNSLNMASANARVFLSFLGLDSGPEPDGDVPVPVARRAVIRARATFERRACRFTRTGADTKRPGQCRVIVGGIDEDYFGRRLDDFERFLGVVVEKGATRIYWG